MNLVKGFEIASLDNVLNVQHLLRVIIVSPINGTVLGISFVNISDQIMMDHVCNKRTILI